MKFGRGSSSVSAVVTALDGKENFDASSPGSEPKALSIHKGAAGRGRSLVCLARCGIRSPRFAAVPQP